MTWLTLKKCIENAPKDDAEKIETLNEIKDIVELILYFNNEDQEGSGLKILTQNFKCLVDYQLL